VSPRTIFLLASLIGALSLAPAAHAQDARVIPQGVSVQGIDLSNQTVDQATVTLDTALQEPLTRTLVVSVGAKDFRLGAPSIGLVFDARLTATRAYDAGVAAAGAPVEVAPSIGWSRAAVRGWARVVRKRSKRKPVNSKVRITLTRIRATHSRIGIDVNVKKLVALVNRTLGDPAAAREIRQQVKKIQPKVTYKTLRNSHGTVVTVDRNNFRLRLFKNLRFVKSYGIAVGMAGLDTPAGLYRIQSKQVNPAWHVPNSAWAGSLAGTTVPGGAPNNPLKARWLGVNGSVGIHGTAESWSIGTRASHGCIRMHVGDVIDLYNRVPMGAPVLIR
jgi:lipoprotein-anchoring transpeptidase ErfK/SrfK